MDRRSQGSGRKAQSLTDRLEKVLQGAARDGQPMPGEPTLVSALSASRPAVREALIRLEERGYLRRRQGASTVVNRSALDIPARFDEQMEQSELIAAMGRTPRVEVVSHAVRTVTPAEAEAYDVPAGATALTTTKIWYADEVPVMLATDTVPVPDRTAPPKDVDPAMSLFDLAELVRGERVEWEIAWPGADALDEERARLLRRPLGEPALTLRLTGVGHSGATAYWAAESHVRDAFRYALVRSVRRV
jgi:GntR family transcriptional regulator